jgi:hypothetical protein
MGLRHTGTLGMLPAMGCARMSFPLSLHPTARSRLLRGSCPGRRVRCRRRLQRTRSGDLLDLRDHLRHRQSWQALSCANRRAVYKPITLAHTSCRKKARDWAAIPPQPLTEDTTLHMSVRGRLHDEAGTPARRSHRSIAVHRIIKCRPTSSLQHVHGVTSEVFITSGCLRRRDSALAAQSNVLCNRRRATSYHCILKTSSFLRNHNILQSILKRDCKGLADAVRSWIFLVWHVAEGLRSV